MNSLCLDGKLAVCVWVESWQFVSGWKVGSLCLNGKCTVCVFGEWAVLSLESGQFMSLESGQFVSLESGQVMSLESGQFLSIDRWRLMGGCWCLYGERAFCFLYVKNVVCVCE